MVQYFCLALTARNATANHKSPMRRSLAHPSPSILHTVRIGRGWKGLKGVGKYLSSAQVKKN